MSEKPTIRKLMRQGLTAKQANRVMAYEAIKPLKDGGKTFREIAKIFKVSRQRIQQIHSTERDLNKNLDRRRTRQRAMASYFGHKKRKAKRDAFENSPEGKQQRAEHKSEMQRYKYWKQNINRKRKNKND